MMYLYFGLFMLLLWWLADKNLKQRFNPYLKWGSLVFIMVLIGFDIFMYSEIWRWVEVCKYQGGTACEGLQYSYTTVDNMTNVTTTHTTFAYGEYSTNTAELMSDLYTEYDIMQLFFNYLPYIALFVITMLGLQYVSIVYYAALDGDKGNKRDKGDSL